MGRRSARQRLRSVNPPRRPTRGFSADRRGASGALGKRADAHLGQIQTRRSDPIRPLAKGRVPPLPRRRARRTRQQQRRTRDPAPDDHTEKRTVRRIRSRRPDLGDDRLAPCDCAPQRRRSQRVAHANPGAYRRGLAKQKYRRAPAMEFLPRLTGRGGRLL